MDQEGPHFINGDKELNIEGCTGRGISEEAAQKIWNQMVDFAKYAFNKSHAAAYAAISMQTAYLKANYPLEFAVGLLTSVMDDSKKLMKYVTSFRQTGVNILPPDVTKSEYGFSIETDDDGNESIRFGLFAIKGVGEDVANTIPAERAKQPYKDIDDFVKRHMSFNRKAFENLAKAGAFDAFGHTRQTLVENFDTMLTSIKTQAKNYDENQLTLFDFGLDVDTSYKFNEYPEYSYLQKCRNEKDATGMYVSGHPASTIENITKKNGAVNIEDIVSENSVYHNDDEVAIGGVITEIKKKITKKGNIMMIIDVEDTTGHISVLLFEHAIQKFRSELNEDGLIFLKGKVRGGGEDSSLILQTVCPLKDTPSILWIATDDYSLNNLRNRVLNFMQDNPGIGDHVKIVSKKARKPEMLGDISITADVLEKAKIHFGRENVKVTQDKSEIA